MLDRVLPKIESNIPLPPSRTARGANEVYGFSRLSVGDSVFFPFVDLRGLDRIRSSLSQYRRRSDRTFATRALTENGVKGLRIWRLS